MDDRVQNVPILKSPFYDEGQGYHFSKPVIAAEFALTLDALLVPPFVSMQVTALSGR